MLFQNTLSAKPVLSPLQNGKSHHLIDRLTDAKSSPPIFSAKQKSEGKRGNRIDHKRSTGVSPPFALDEWGALLCYIVYEEALRNYLCASF